MYVHQKKYVHHGCFSDSLISSLSIHCRHAVSQNRLPNSQLERTSTYTGLLARYPSVETTSLSAFYAILVREDGGLALACDWPGQKRVQMILILIGPLGHAWLHWYGSGADMWQKLVEMFTSGRKCGILHTEVFWHAEFKNGRIQEVWPLDQPPSWIPIWPPWRNVEYYYLGFQMTCGTEIW